jgi:hypothetical protein
LELGGEVTRAAGQSKTMPSPGSPSPELLLEQARAGDREALGRLLELYRNYLELLYRSLAGCGRGGRFDQSDVVQETFLKAHQGFRQFAGSSESELVAWLRTNLARAHPKQVNSHYQFRRRACKAKEGAPKLFGTRVSPSVLRRCRISMGLVGETCLTATDLGRPGLFGFFSLFRKSLTDLFACDRSVGLGKILGS